MSKVRQDQKPEIGNNNEPLYDRDVFLNYSKKLSTALTNFDWSPVLSLATELSEAKRSGSKIFLCGNGGSAANSNHIANDLVYAVAQSTGGGLDATSLCANNAVLTCLANDVGYEEIFSEQLTVSAQKDDILIALSGSGSSPNIIRAIETGKEIGMKTYAILGFDGGKCINLVDKPIHFKVDDMQIVEDFQLISAHMIMKWLKANPK